MLAPCPTAGTSPSRQNPGNPAHQGGATKSCRPIGGGRRAQKCPAHNSCALRWVCSAHSIPPGSMNPSPPTFHPQTRPFPPPFSIATATTAAQPAAKQVAAIMKLSEQTSGLRLAVLGYDAKKPSTIPTGYACSAPQRLAGHSPSTTAACFPPSGWQSGCVFCSLIPPDPSFTIHRSHMFDLLLTLKQQHKCALKTLKLEELKRRGKNKSGKKSYSVFESKGAWNSSQRSYP